MAASNDRGVEPRSETHFDAIIVGSGFGGSVTAHRLAAAGLRVCVLERGKAYPPGSFARSPYEMQRNFWDPSAGLQGLFDIWSFRGTEAVVASGLGGGSLIYANVLLRKDEKWFVHESPLPGGGYEHWPISRADLDPHYDAVEQMLRAQRYPVHAEPYASTPKTLALKEAAERLGHSWQLPLLAVTFGNPGEPPVPGEPVRDEDYPNLHGRLRTTCRLCGDCDIGCNYGSKNTLDHTYLSAAAAAGAELRTRSEVRRIAPRAGGGYTVAYVHHDEGAEGRRTRTDRLPHVELTADRVVLAAGALGTSYLLLRNRSALRGLSAALGTRFSGNGDLLSFLVGARQPDGSARRIEGSRGPVITSAIRVADEVDGGTGRGFYVEDAGYPGFAEWMAEAANTPSTAWRAGRFLAARLAARVSRSPKSSLGAELQSLLGSADLSAGTVPLLGMGRDVPDGVLRLRGGYLDVDWTSRTSEAYFAGVRSVMRDIAGVLGARFEDNPIWHLRKRVVTVHALGGAPMGRHPGEGVVDSHGEVFGHPGLYVADGAALPGPVGANPSLTIAAFADRLATRLVEQAEQDRGHRPAAQGAAPVTVVAQRAMPAAERADAAHTIEGETVSEDSEQPVGSQTEQTAAAAPTRLEFTEEMKGFVTLGEVDPQRGFDRGRAARTPFMFHLTIAVEDMDHFLVDADREGVAVGWVDCDVLGGRLPVERGIFNLFVHSAVDGGDPNRSRMLYRLHFRDGVGTPLTMTGFKDVHDDPGFDLWRDTSTLFVRLLSGHVGPTDDAVAPVVGAGIITIHVPDFLQQLTTFRTSGPTAASRARAMESFGRVFLGELWNTYGPRVREAAGSTR